MLQEGDIQSARRRSASRPRAADRSDASRTLTVRTGVSDAGRSWRARE